MEKLYFEAYFWSFITFICINIDFICETVKDDVVSYLMKITHENIVFIFVQLFNLAESLS